MKHFKRMIEHVRRKMIIPPLNNIGTEISINKKYPNIAKKEYFYNLVEQAQPFVFVEDEGGSWENKEKSSSTIDAPFPVFTIEQADEGYILTFPSSDSDIVAGGFVCLMIAELNPKEYIVYTYYNTEHNEPLVLEYYLPDIVAVDVISPSTTSGNLRLTFKQAEKISSMVELPVEEIIKKTKTICIQTENLIISFLKKLANRRTGLEKTKQRIRIGSGKEKRIHTIRRIVHVCSKNNIIKYEKKLIMRKIDWSHRWSVRGHWRIAKGIGKDRTGDYCVSGYTWVKDCIKGNPEKEFVKKTRIVLPSNPPEYESHTLLDNSDAQQNTVTSQ